MFSATDGHKFSDGSYIVYVFTLRESALVTASTDEYGNEDGLL